MQPKQANSEPTSGEPRPRLLVNVRDQGSLLALVGSLLVLASCWWLYQGGHRGGVVHIERADPLTARYLVDINRADWPEMTQLPGIGETLARRIIGERETHGPFLDNDELTRVDGIGLRTLERVRPYLMPIAKDTDWAAVDDDSSSALP